MGRLFVDDLFGNPKSSKGMRSTGKKCKICRKRPALTGDGMCALCSMARRGSGY